MASPHFGIGVTDVVVGEKAANGVKQGPGGRSGAAASRGFRSRIGPSYLQRSDLSCAKPVHLGEQGLTNWTLVKRPLNVEIDE